MFICVVCWYRCIHVLHMCACVRFLLSFTTLFHIEAEPRAREESQSALDAPSFHLCLLRAGITAGCHAQPNVMWVLDPNCGLRT